MTVPPDPLLDELERDMEPAAAAAFLALVTDYLAGTRTGDGPVSTARTPGELAARLAEALPAEGRPLADVIARLRADVLPDCNRLAHPRAMGHQVSAPLGAAVWAEALTAALNQSAAVWEMSPVGTILELQVIRWMSELAGLGPSAGGTFTSGGTEATFAGLLAARHAALPDAWARGVGADPPVVVCGEHAHYAVGRAVGELGLGAANVVVVPSRGFTMSVDALAETLDGLRAAARRVMAVVATAGTTATGSFDDLDAIGRLCEQHGHWLHVDAAHGGSALFSTAHRHRMAGVGRARSVAWDPHKMMLLPLSAGVVLVREQRDLDAAFAQQAPYLFHVREDGRVWDQGVRSFACSRRVDALKVWVAIQRFGATGLGRIYDRLCATAGALHDAVVARHDFEAIHEPESNIVCFRYTGSRRLDEAALDGLNLRLREEFNRGGDGWITTTVLGGCRVLRATVMNPRTTAVDLACVLDGLAEVGARLAGDA